MARPLDETVHDTVEDPRSDAVSSRVDRSAARAFAAAVSALLISTFVVSQSSAAIDPDGTVAGNSVTAGTVELTDDDQGRSLVNLEALAPARPVEECIEVSYDGTILPVELTLDTQTIGDLGPYLGVIVERGVGGSFDDCDQFDAEEQVFAGTLAELDQVGAMPLGSVFNTGDKIAFRFRFELADEADAAGLQSSIDFVWEAAP